MVNGIEHISRESILRQWVRRFSVKSAPHSHPDEAARITREVASFPSDMSYDIGGAQAMTSLNGPIREEEIVAALAKAKPGKTPGPDLILNEMLTRGGPRLIESICKLLNILWDCELISPDWKQLLIAPVYKKGSPIDPDNYRPIALLSNIFKLYERVIDVRIRAVISFQLEQCGFQPGFGTPQQLLRMTILHKSVKAAGQELWIALIDLEKAFERVWRVGLLHQLWVRGVRGKLWRIISDILRHTIATVRTNFGDSDPFSVDIGVLQGSVLAAVLFLIFIDPLIVTLRPLCPSFHGTLIGPLLFADDILIAALSRAARTLLVTACIQWLRSNGADVNASKSTLQSPESAGLQGLHQRIEGLNFFEKPHGLWLGVHTSNTGVYTIHHVLSRLHKFAVRLYALTRNGLAPGGIRPDVGAALFEWLVISLADYALGLCDPKSHLIQRLDKAQDDFAIDLLGLPASFPGFVARRELGLLDFSLRASRSALLLLLRVHILSDDDPLTLLMLDWPISNCPSPSTHQSESAALARSIGITMPFDSFLDLQYGDASALIDEAIHATQQRRWTLLLHSKLCQDTLPGLTMPTWEIDAASCPVLLPAHRATFIMARASSLPHACCYPHTVQTCHHCGAHLATVHHLLWACPRSAQLRMALFESLSLLSPHAVAYLASAGNHGPSLTHHLLVVATRSMGDVQSLGQQSTLSLVAAFLHSCIESTT